jgi:hypothetical protein
MNGAGKRTPLTETELLHRLRVRHGEKAGNGYAHAFMTGVRSAAGFDAKRTIDAYSMALWPSRGLTLTAYECKSSRSDWQRELKKPDKAEEFCERADYFYMVVGSPDIVLPGELPETWGLMVPHGKALKVAVEAPRLRPASSEFPPGVDRSFLAALLRAATAVGAAGPVEIKEAEARGFEHGKQVGEAGSYEQAYAELREHVDAFQREAGINIAGYRFPKEVSPAEMGAIVKLVVNGDYNVESATYQLRSLHESAVRIAEIIRGHLPVEAA